MALQMAPIPLYVKQGRVWLQRTEMAEFHLLENHGISNIIWPVPAPTAIRAQSKWFRTGVWMIDVTQGDIEMPTFTIPTMLFGVRNYLMSLGLEKINVQVLTGPDGNPTQYGAANYGIGWVLATRGQGNVAAGAIFNNAGEGAPVTFETPFAAVVGPIPIDWTTDLAVKTACSTQTSAAKGVFCIQELKGESPMRRVLPGEVGMIVASSSQMVYFTDGLKSTPTWINPSSVPTVFTGDATINTVIGYGDKFEPRFIMGGGPSVSASDPIIMYTADYGTTFTLSNTTASGSHASGDTVNRLWFVDASKIYAVGGKAGSGVVWISRDGGATFVGYSLGTSQPARDICVCGNGIGYAVGDSNTIAKCSDFDNFSAITGPAGLAGKNITTVAVKNSTGTVLIGSSDGNVYYSQDGGVNWHDCTSSIQGYTPTAIRLIRFDQATGEYGYMIIGTASGDIAVRTTNGGQTWENYNLGDPASGALMYDMQVIAPNHMIACGATSSVAANLATILLAQSNFDGGRLV